MELKQLIDILYDQAIDGEFTRNKDVIKFIDKLTETQKEILEACYWIGWNNSYEERMDRDKNN